MLFLFSVGVLGMAAQSELIKVQKPLKAWVSLKEDTLHKGLLTGFSATDLQIYPGSKNEFINHKSADLTTINYKDINIVRTKKPGVGGIIKGMAIGGLIGLVPVVFGEGGAYVAIVSFPVGIVTGAIVGATSKKKYTINGNLTSFQKFTAKRF